MEEDQKWGLSIQEADKERWRRAKAVFREHPLLTICCFVLSAAEHAIHPSPDVLIWGRLNFYADSLALGLLWVGLLLFAYFGWRCDPDPEWDDGTINRSFLTAALAVCLVLTLGSGISFGAGARLRAPLEMIVPLLAAVGVVRFVRAFRSVHRATLPQRERQVNNRSSPILAVLMPVYNEAHTVEAVIKKILAAPVDMEIRLYIVDDCSTDASSKVIQRLAAQDLRVTVLHHPVNRGKGAAIRTAIANAQGDFVIIQDADLEYDPTDYPRILAPLLRGDADAVFGSRYLYNVKRYIYGFWHTLANATLTTLFNVAHNVHLTDMETCYKAMPLRLLKSLRLTSDRFGFEVEITSRLVALKSRIVEVPIAYHPRDYRSGKKIGWRDGLEALYLIIKFRFFNTIPSDDAELVGQIAMSKAPRYHKWFAAKIGPFLGRRVLDAGAGIGNLSIHIAEKHKLFLVEPRKECLKLLETNIGYRDDVAVSNVDLFSEEGVQWAKAVEPDSVLCIDKLDRINDEAEALSRLAVLLPRGGTLIVRAAANNSLYGKLDQSLGLRRRYEMRELVELVSAAGFIVIHQRQYGKLDALMWFFRSRIFRHEKLGRGYLAALNLVTPFLGIMEDVIPGKNNFVVVVGKKAT